MLYLRRFNRFVLSSLVLLGLSNFILTSTSHASVFTSGQEYNWQYLVPNDSAVIYNLNFTVASGCETGISKSCAADQDALVDFSTDMVEIDFLRPGRFGTKPVQFNGWKITDINDNDVDYRGVSWTVDTNLAGISLGSLIFTENTIALDWQEVSRISTSYFKLSAALNPVPVPAAIWLFGTALIGLVGFGRRRKTA